MHKLTAYLTIAFLFFAYPVQAQSLVGSRTSMQRQNQAAINYGYTFIENSQAITNFVNSGRLVKVNATKYLELSNVSYPYTRPAVLLFLDRLSAQYRSSCDEKLTITSLTRPINKQPANASEDSVHPAGMAVDLRIPAQRKCRSWLEKTLLELEAEGVLDVTRERKPAHYHVAVFTESYAAFVQLNTTPNSQEQSVQEYIVRRGDSLSRIASKMDTSIPQLRAANGLTSDVLQVGQKLNIATTTNNAPAIANLTDSATAKTDTKDVAAHTQVTHRVKRGDSLWLIAKLYNTSVKLLRRKNNLANDVLHVGQNLQISLN